MIQKAYDILVASTPPPPPPPCLIPPHCQNKYINQHTNRCAETKAKTADKPQNSTQCFLEVMFYLISFRAWWECWQRSFKFVQYLTPFFNYEGDLQYLLSLLLFYNFAHHLLIQNNCSPRAALKKIAVEMQGSQGDCSLPSIAEQNSLGVWMWFAVLGHGQCIDFVVCLCCAWFKQQQLLNVFSLCNQIIWQDAWIDMQTTSPDKSEALKFLKKKNMDSFYWLPFANWCSWVLSCSVIMI